MHVQCRLKISKICTLAKILSKIFVKKRRKIGKFIYDHGLTNEQFGVSLIFIKVYYAITAWSTYNFTFGKC